MQTKGYFTRKTIVIENPAVLHVVVSQVVRSCADNRIIFLQSFFVRVASWVSLPELACWRAIHTRASVHRGKTWIVSGFAINFHMRYRDTLQTWSILRAVTAGRGKFLDIAKCKVCEEADCKILAACDVRLARHERRPVLKAKDHLRLSLQWNKR